MLRHVTDYFEKPHHSKLCVAVHELDALLRQSRSTNCR
jgi:hypothetical protein